MSNKKNIEAGCGFSEEKDAFLAGKNAATQALKHICEYPISVVMVFASASYDLEDVLSGITGVTGDSPVIGTTTAGEICGSPHQQSVVVAVLASPYLKTRTGIGRGVSKNWHHALMQALKSPEIYPFISSESNVWEEVTQQGKSIFAMLFSPGNTRLADSRSYEILEEMKRLFMGRIDIFGGSSADDWLMEKNYVFSMGKVYPDSILVILFETSLKYGAAVAHGFHASERKAVVTDVQDHEVVKLGGQSAADVYAQWFDVTKESLQNKHLTITTECPLGIRDATGQYAICVASYFTPRGGVRITHPVSEGTVLTVMEPVENDMLSAGVEAARKALMRSSIASAAAAFVFSCALRVKILKDKYREEIFNVQEVLPGVTIAGFYSFGEQGVSDDGVSRHHNEVVNVLLIGQELAYPAQVAMENRRLREQLEIRVHESENARKRLGESEAKYKELVENANSVIYKRDKSGNIIFFNEFAQKLFGYSQEEVIGKSVIGTILPEQDPEGHPYRDIILDISVHPENYTYHEKECFRKNGDKVWIAWTNKVVLDVNGNVDGVLCIGTDITDRKRAEAKVRESEENYRTFFEIIDDIVVVGSLDGRIKYVNTAASDILGYNPDELHSMLIPDLHPESVRGKAETILSDMIKGKRDTCPLPMLSKNGVVVPVETRVWFGKWSGENCMFFISKDLSKEQEALQKFDKLFRMNPALMAVSMLPEQILADVNDAFLHVLGYSAEEVIGRTSSELHLFVDEEEQKKIALLLNEHGSIREFELQVRTKDGRFLDGLFSGEIIESQGNKYFLTVMTDITAHRRAEATIRNSEKRYRTLAEAMQDMIFIINQNDAVEYVNRVAMRYLGKVSEEEVVGKKRATFFPQEIAERQSDNLRRVFETGKPLNIEDVLMFQGREVWTNTWLVPLKDDAGTIKSVLGVSRDVSTRKHMEFELKSSEERFRIASQSTNDIIWDSNLKNDTFKCFGDIEGMLGYNAGELSRTNETWKMLIHPDDRNRVTTSLECHINDHTPYHEEYRVIKKNGEICYWDDRGIAIYDADGIAYRVVGACTDITKKKQAETALRLSREALKESEKIAKELMNIYPESAFFMDTDGVFLAANDTVARRLGKTVDELTGCCMYDFLPSDLAASRKTKTEEVILKKKPAHFIDQCGDKWADIVAYPILDEHENVVKIAVYAQNITRQKNAELELAKRAEELAISNRNLEERNREISIMGRTSDLLQACKTIDEAYAIVSQSFTALFPDFSGALYIHNAPRNVLDCVASFGKNPPAEKLFDIDDCWSLRLGKTNFVKSPSAGALCLHVKQKGISSYLCVPMIVLGEILGMFHIRGEALESNVKFIENMVNQIGLALANIRLRETLRIMSIRDPLTGLYNRRHMDVSVERELLRAARHETQVGIIMLDIDHFKDFNDRFGHEAGDGLLKELGRLFQQHIRGSDIACRYGGEEFLIILPDTSTEVSVQRAEHLRENTKRLYIQHGGKYYGEISISLGVATFPEHGSTAEDVIHAADAALYRAKREGRDRVCLATPQGVETNKRD